METTRQNRPRARRGLRSLVAVGASLIMLLTLMAPVSAQEDEEATISGNATPSACNRDRGAGAIRLTGDLQGCLIFFPGRFRCTELNGFALYEEWGREVFVGRYNGERGRFRTKYDLTATYSAGSCAEFNDGGFPFLNQLTGGCNHKIIGKSGAFARMRGLITFHDVIPVPGQTGASNFYYSGYLS